MPSGHPIIGPRSRERGNVLVIVLILTMAMAMLTLSAIALRSSDAIYIRSHEAARQFRYSVDTALAIGKSRLMRDTSILLPDSGFLTLLSGANVSDANGAPMPGITVNVYVGLRGSDQRGELVTLVAEARDTRGQTRYVRALELVAESAARYGMLDSVPADIVSLTKRARLGAFHDRALSGHLDVTASGTSLTSARTRVEFVAIDVNDDGDVIDAEEGFLRVFQAIDPHVSRAGDSSKIRDDRCGDWHDVLPGSGVLLEFFPLSVHDDEWFAARGFADAAPAPIDASRRHRIMRGSGARCYPAGDPHLVAVERVGVAGYSATDWEKGGNDTTFTPTGRSGQWLPFASAVPEILNAIPTVRQAAEAPYLWPLSRALNPAARGVVHVHGAVLLSGVLRGRVTLYSSGDVGFVDDLTYAQDSTTVRCADILGVIADGDATIVDDGIASTRETPWIIRGAIVSRSEFVETRSADRCLLDDSPPHFPTTGRYTTGRSYEVDPARFDPHALFQQLQDGL